MKKIKITPVLARGDYWHIIIGLILSYLVPDIDHHKSMFNRFLFKFNIFICNFFVHRGFTHSILAIIIIILLFIFQIFPLKIIIYPDILHTMIIGYISHILADIFTPAGVSLLWPYRYRFCIFLFNYITNYKIKSIKNILYIIIFIISFLYV